jgi:hypothetical protein
MNEEIIIIEKIENIENPIIEINKEISKSNEINKEINKERSKSPSNENNKIKRKRTSIFSGNIYMEDIEDLSMNVKNIM